MMTPEDGFDARLRAAFEKADAQITPDPAFTRRVLGRLGKSVNPRLLVLGSAGATGSALASAQLERLVDGIQFHNAVLTQVFDTFGAQGIVAAAFTLAAASLAYALPRVRL